MSSILYFTFGPGLKFFPNVDSDNILISVKVKESLSAKERDLILKKVEENIWVLKKKFYVFMLDQEIFQITLLPKFNWNL
ncbi:hypothetical protein [Wolbachia endosymbiont of Trichogramma pretiosum]|uniref:hypothetical protein n=1 Tax=Wolbachia endosymbiont of Trichogramma pretiosum TaxID=125593 RepID=UPI000AE2D27A|nr:hypothetical protein [Wolbachia endosymbiont of Trichogramma pretiosum]